MPNREQRNWQEFHPVTLFLSFFFSTVLLFLLVDLVDCDAKDRSQNLVCAKQVPYHWVTPQPQPYLMLVPAGPDSDLPVQSTLSSSRLSPWVLPASFNLLGLIFISVDALLQQPLLLFPPVSLICLRIWALELLAPQIGLHPSPSVPGFSVTRCKSLELSFPSAPTVSSPLPYEMSLNSCFYPDSAWFPWLLF